MESGKPSLLSQGISSTDLLPRSQGVHFKDGLTNAGSLTSFSVIPARPGSSMPTSRLESRPGSSMLTSRLESRPGSSMLTSRLESRPMSSRPMSRLDQSRPGSRIDSRPSSRMLDRQQSSVDTRQRPCSAIRPLSSRVFMRRTERGWVAKHYPDHAPTSLTNLESELDELSDCDSLDSFFDEDFDDRQHSEKLGNLLTCNTLGVEAKDQKRDWNGVEGGIPKFHCPRCHDHWYGITAFPCDEELARLIKEGLWYTGRGDSSKIPTREGTGEQSGILGNGSESGSTSSVLGGSTKGRKSSGVLRGENGHRNAWSMGREDGETDRKSKRRITFKLHDKEEGEGSGLLDDGGGTQDKRGLSSKHGGDSGSGDVSGGNRNGVGGLSSSVSDDGSSSSLLNGVSSLRSGRSKKDGLESDNSGLLESSGSNDSLTRRRRRRGRGRKDGGSSSDILKGVSRGGSKTTAKKRGGGGGGSKTQLHDDVGMGLANALADRPGNGRDSQNSGHTDTSTIRAELDNGDSKAEDLEHGLSSQGSQSSLTSNKNKKSETGPNHGRRVRKAGGYMRTVSPTESEWGDPTHARPYASSTTTSSQVGSTFNLLKDKEENKTSLPPIIPPITGRQKPLVDFSDMMNAFELTPPWRYSYYSPSPLHAQAARPATVASGRSGRRK